MNKILTHAVLVTLFYGPEEEAAAAKAKAEEEAKAKAKTYTQEEFDHHAAGLRRKAEADSKAAVAELTKLKESNKNNSELNQTLTSQIESLEKTYMTEKELKDREIASLEKRRKDEVETVTKDRDAIKKSFEDLTIEIELTKEATIAEELVPGQLSKHIRGDTVLMDDIGEDGKPTGKKVVKIKLQDVDKKTNKPIELVLPVKDAFKRMKEVPERYGNFFKGMSVSGVGANNTRGGSDGAMPTDTESYIANRNKKKD